MVFGGRKKEKEPLLGKQERPAKYGPNGKEKKETEGEKLPPVSLRKLYRCATGFDFFLLLMGCVFSLINGAVQPLNAILSGSLLNVLIPAETEVNVNGTDLGATSFETRANEVILQYVYVGCFLLVVAYVQGICWHVSCERQIHKIRQLFLRAILRQDVAWYDVNQSGALTTKLTDNIERMKEGMGDKVGVMLQSAAQFLSGFVIAFVYSWKMTLVMMAFTPVIAICIALIGRVMATATRKEMHNYSQAGAIAEEVLASVRTVIAFNGQKREIQRYEEKLILGRRMGILKSVYSGAIMAVFFTVMFSAFGLAFWFGSTLIVSEGIEPGVVFTVFFSVMTGSMAIGMVGPQIVLVITAKGAAAPIYEVIDRIPDIDSYSTEGAKPTVVSGKIEFSNVHFRYPTRHEVKVLNGVSYSVEPGQTVALVGHSGCGKSTMVSLLLRYYSPESGNITIDGKPITDLNVNWLRNTIGVVSQEPVLFDTTIAENLRLGRETLSRQEMINVCRMANAHHFIMKLPQNYDTMVGEGGIQLSGGQKQRIAIARALARDPKILLLDEATSALDAESEGAVQKALEQASKGRTTLVIAHRLSTIRNADKIIVLQNGSIMEVGSHRELMDANGIYHQLVAAQTFQTDLSGEMGEESGKIDSHPQVDRNVSYFSDASEVSSAFRRKASKKFSRVLSKTDTTKERLITELEEEGAKKSNFFEIFKQTRSDWSLIFLAFSFSVLRGLMMPLFSLVSGQIFTTFSKVGDELTSNAITNALLFVALGVVQGIAGFACAVLYGISGERLTMRLRMAVFKNILRQDMSYFDDPRHSSGKLTTRLASDAPNVKSAVDQRLASILQGFISLFSGIVISFIYGWQMALVGLVMFTVLVGAQVLVARWLQGRDKKDVRLTEEGGRIATEAIENARTVQSLTRERLFYDRFSQSMLVPHKNNLIKAQMQAILYSLSSSLTFFIYAACYRFGVFLISTNATTPYAAYHKILVCFSICIDHFINYNHVRNFMVITSLGMSTMGIMNAAAYFPEYLKARLAAGLIFKMIQTKPKIDNYAENGIRAELNGNVDLKAVYFAYPTRNETPVLKGLTIDASKGKTLALVGPSGCGKSTVISLLERFYDPTDGRLDIDNYDLRTLNLKHLRDQIALVSQEPVLFDCSIADNISYGLQNVPHDKIVDAAKMANIHDYVESLPEKYETRVGEKGTQLSGGQKQRVAIARAIIRNPKILLLDEATSALDTESEKVVHEALEKASVGRTCIVIAHRLSTIQNADCIVVIEHGQVVEQGTHHTLIAQRGIYHGMTKLQDLH